MIKNESDLSNIKGFVVIIPAAGIGKRFGSDVAKQYLKLNGQYILDLTLNLFLDSSEFDKIVLAISPQDECYKLLKAISHEKLIVIDGGEQRQFSVNNALRYLYDNGLPFQTGILVHDSVRPCLADSDLKKLIEFYRKTQCACFLAEPVSDSLKRIDPEKMVTESVSRDNLVRAQTPQLSSFEVLKNALSKVTKGGVEVTDEVGALTECDVKVAAVLSEHPNPKITRPKDLELVEQILAAQ